MNKPAIASTLGLMALAFIVEMVPGLPKAVASTVTTTVTGWNVPSGTTFGHGIVVLILPLATMGLFAALPLMVDQRGPIVVFMALIGLTLGGIIGMMSLSSVATTDVSFGFIVVSGLYLFLWLWKGQN